MDWVCTDCGQTYHESPMDCQLCGHDVVVPEDDPRATPSFFEELKWRIVDPMRANRSLRTNNTYLVWAVRVLFVASGLFVLLALLL